MKSAFQGKFSYTMAARGLLNGELMMVRRMTVFAVANEMGRGGVPAIMMTYGHWLAAQRRP